VPSQSENPAEQVPVTHAELRHTGLLAFATFAQGLHEPQCCGSFRSSTQLLLQLESGLAHVAVHELMLQTVPLPQLAPALPEPLPQPSVAPQN
jgi:hypothetical protein